MKIPLTFARGVAVHLGFKVAIVFAALLSASLPASAESGETAQGPKEFRTAIIYDDLFLEHDTGPRFPEHPERLRWLIPHLKQHPVGGRLLWTAPSEKIHLLRDGPSRRLEQSRASAAHLLRDGPSRHSLC